MRDDMEPEDVSEMFVDFDAYGPAPAVKRVCPYCGGRMSESA